ncbi:MAG: hypothetical protein LBU95_02450 [Rikenellaceae bacterium]|nr:hypothetical protein [Rikenellaceae bacterium]
MELSSADPALDRFNIYLTLVGYDANHAQVCLESSKDGELKLACRPCATAEGYVSVVAHTLPRETQVPADPGFAAVLVARADGREVFRREYTVNPWGGLSLAGIVFDGRVAL